MHMKNMSQMQHYITWIMPSDEAHDEETWERQRRRSKSLVMSLKVQCPSWIDKPTLCTGWQHKHVLLILSAHVPHFSECSLKRSKNSPIHRMTEISSCATKTWDDNWIFCYILFLQSFNFYLASCITFFCIRICISNWVDANCTLARLKFQQFAIFQRWTWTKWH